MIHNRPCVNGILAAVLSASILPIHGALAKEEKDKTTAAHKTVEKPAIKKPMKPAAGKDDAAKPDAAGAGDGGAPPPDKPQ
jgi:hypothetical protein